MPVLFHLRPHIFYVLNHETPIIDGRNKKKFHIFHLKLSPKNHILYISDAHLRH